MTIVQEKMGEQSPRAPAAWQPLAEILEAPRRYGRLRGFVRNHPKIALGGTLLGLMALVAVFAPLLATSDPLAISPAQRTRFPSSEHWFGTDNLGRDVYSRVIYGARVSLIVGLSVAALVATCGTLVGIVSGFLSALDKVIMRILDGIMAIPSILLAIALMAIAGPSIANVIIAISLAEGPRMARLVRGVVLSLRQQPYVEAAYACGSSVPKILIRHILPNVVAPVIVQASYVCAAAMLAEALLSFLGAGTPPSIPSWGNIMAEGRILWQVRPYLVLFPALFLSLTVLSVNWLGDGIREAFDPRFSRSI